MVHSKLLATKVRKKKLVFLLAAISVSFGAVAQITPAQERDIETRNQKELQRQQQQESQQRQQLERAPDVRFTKPEAAASPALPVESPCFAIQQLQLKNPAGANVPEFDWLAQQLAASNRPVILGQCVGAKGVAWLIEQTKKILVDRGYVTTQVLAGPQDISQGTLVLTLVPGRIRAIRLKEPVDPRANLSTALPMQVGDLLNLRDIEQALENLKRIPTAEANIEIEPSKAQDAQQGDSDLVVTYHQQFPLRLTFSVDDSGTKSTGKYQGASTLNFDNMLGLNDMFYVSETKDLGGGDSGPRGTRTNAVHYSLPLGYWTLGTASSVGSYYQTVAGLNQNYVYRGTNENHEIKLNRLLMRDGAQKLNLAFRAFQRKSNNYVDDTEVQVQKRVVGGWDSTLNHKIFIQDATLESNLSYKRGTGAFGSLPAPEEATNEGTSRFALVTADANLALPFKLGSQAVRYNGTWRIQENKTPLTPQDRFAIGGRYTVRGYDGEAVLSAERGWLWRNDLSFALGNSGQEIYAGLDTGQVGGPTSDLLVTKRLTGSVLGVRGSFQKLNYDIFVGAPVNKHTNFKTASTTAGFSVSVSF